jgi:hypothetical protein
LNWIARPYKPESGELAVNRRIIFILEDLACGNLEMSRGNGGVISPPIKSIRRGVAR